MKRPPRDPAGARPRRRSAAPRTRELSAGERMVVRDLARRHAGADDAPRVEALLVRYLEEFLGWTRDSNLVAQADLGRLASRHLHESLAALERIDPRAPGRLVDVGSGGGFPGVPLAILRPAMHVTVVESRRRKGLFLQRVVGVLGLENLAVAIERAERLSWAPGERADMATARAVAVIPELLPILAPLVRTGGIALLFKGSSHTEELAAWQKTPDPAWRHLETHSDPEHHLHFVLFERTPHGT